MGESRSPEELAGKLIGYGTGLALVSKKVLETASLTVKSSVLSQAARPLGTDLSFTGSGSQRPKRVGVRYDVNRDRSIIRATGPMHWLESGIKPHVIAPKGAGGSRRSRNDFVSQAFGSGLTSLSFGRGNIGALKIGPNEYIAYARKAGKFPAQRTWSNGVKYAEPIVKKTWRQQHAQNLVKAFR